MTTEIAILNRHAVVLAADSAVSTTEKVFQSANKIFCLSKYHPIGLMIYSKADFHGIPWETIIKLYRYKLGTKNFSELSEYVGDFLTFLITAQEMTSHRPPERDMIKETAIGFIVSIDHELQNKMESLARQHGTVEEKRIIEEVKGLIRKEVAEIKHAPELSLRTQLPEALFEKRYGRVIKEVHSEAEGFVPTALTVKELTHAVYEITTRAVFPFGYSGLVFAGYGENEIFPQVRTVNIGDIIGGNLQCHQQGHQQGAISTQVTAQVIGFAQQDVIGMFMQGVHPDYLLAADNAYYDTITKLAEAILAQVKDEDQNRDLQEYIGRITRELKQQLKERLAEVRERKYIQPIVQVIEILPPVDVANLAEALVNLTTIQRQMSLEQATVGGPTDVAMITKGDGFIWIKRKHYFDPALNHHFFANYFRGGRHGAENTQQDDL